jgi:hypothetical protein
MMGIVMNRRAAGHLSLESDHLFILMAFAQESKPQIDASDGFRGAMKGVLYF